MIVIAFFNVTSFFLKHLIYKIKPFRYLRIQL